VELSIRGNLRGFGLEVGEVSKARFAARIRKLIGGQPMLERVVEPMVRAREALQAEFHVLHRAMLAIVRADAARRRLITVPGVRALLAVTFRSSADNPARFRRSPAVVGARFGLTHPRRDGTLAGDHPGGRRLRRLTDTRRTR
jgi:transposase